MNDIHTHIFKLRLGALIPRSVFLSVGRKAGRSVYLPVLQNLQNFTKPLKTLENDKTRIFCPPFMCEDRQGSFGSRHFFNREADLPRLF